MNPTTPRANTLHPRFNSATWKADLTWPLSDIPTIAARLYVSPRRRPLNDIEDQTRRTAYALKLPTADALETAAREMAALLDGQEHAKTLTLMPIPTSAGSIEPNRQLCHAVATVMRLRYQRFCLVKATIARMHPVESSCARRRRGLPGLTPEEHAFIRIAGPLTATGTAYYFVDNVRTTGSTITAARLALGFGDALVWAAE